MLDIALFLTEMVKHPEAYTRTKRLKSKVKVKMLPIGVELTNFPYYERITITSYKRFMVLFENGYMEVLTKEELGSMLLGINNEPLTAVEFEKLRFGEWVRAIYVNSATYAVIRVPSLISDLNINGIRGQINPKSVVVPTGLQLVGQPIDTNFVHNGVYANSKEETYIVAKLYNGYVTNEVCTMPQTLLDGLFNKTNLQYKWNITTATLIFMAHLLNSIKLLSWVRDGEVKDIKFSGSSVGFISTAKVVVNGNKELRISFYQQGDTVQYQLGICSKEYNFVLGYSKVGGKEGRVNTTDLEGYARLKNFINQSVKSTVEKISDDSLWVALQKSENLNKVKLSLVYSVVYEAFKSMPGKVQARMKSDEMYGDMLLLQHKYPNLVQPVGIRMIYNSEAENLEWTVEVTGKEKAKLPDIHLSIGLFKDKEVLNMFLSTMQVSCSRDYIRHMNKIIDELGADKGILYGNTGMAVQQKQGVISEWKSALLTLITEEMRAKFNGKVACEEGKDVYFTVDGIKALVIRFNGNQVKILNKKNTVSVKVDEPTDAFIHQLAQNCANFCIL